MLLSTHHPLAPVSPQFQFVLKASGKVTSALGLGVTFTVACYDLALINGSLQNDFCMLYLRTVGDVFLSWLLALLFSIRICIYTKQDLNCI